MNSKESFIWHICITFKLFFNFHFTALIYVGKKISNYYFSLIKICFDIFHQEFIFESIHLKLKEEKIIETKKRLQKHLMIKFVPLTKMNSSFYYDNECFEFKSISKSDLKVKSSDLNLENENWSNWFYCVSYNKCYGFILLFNQHFMLIKRSTKGSSCTCME